MFYISANQKKMLTSKPFIFCFLSFITLVLLACDSSNTTPTIPTDSVPPSPYTPSGESEYFPDGIACLSRPLGFVCIDSKGQKIEALSSESIKKTLNTTSLYGSKVVFNEGYAPIMYKDERGEFRWRYIDKAGKIAGGSSYSFASSFENGHAIVNENNKWGLINQEGKVVIPLEYDAVSPVMSERVWVKRGEVWQLLDFKTLSQITQIPIKIWGKFNESGVCWVEKWIDDPSKIERAYMDINGQLLSPWYSNATDFKNGFSTFEQNDKWGFVNQKGEVVVSPKFDYVESFSEGKAAFNIFSPEGGFGKWGVINQAGEVIVQAEYDGMGSYSGGLIDVRNAEENMGFLDKEGRLAIGFIYNATFPFSEGLSGVRVGNKWGFINAEGMTLIPFKYDEVVPFPLDPFRAGYSGGVAKVKVNGHELFINKKGECVMGCLE